MNPVFQLLLDSLLRYAQTHPEEIEKLIATLIHQAITAMTKPPTTT